MKIATAFLLAFIGAMVIGTFIPKPISYVLAFLWGWNCIRIVEFIIGTDDK